MRFLYSLALGLLSGWAAQAQQPAAPRLRAADLALGGEQCARAHIRAASRTATSSVRHRQKMDRYDVLYYKLDIALENNSRNVSGSGLIRARNVSGQPLDSMAFELFNRDAVNNWGFFIDSVVVDGRRSSGWRRAGHDVTARLPQAVAAGAAFEARIYYRGTAPHGNTAAIGNALDTDTKYGVNVTWSLSEPFSAHEWFPVKQALTDKADSSAVWVTTTNPNKAGSNGVLRRVTPLSGNRSRYEWHGRSPIAYYLLSVAVAPYVQYTNYANPAGGPRIPIVNYVYNQTALNDYQADIDRTPGLIENFSSLVGLYPFAHEKYGHCTAPIGGGMEHQTMTTQDGFSFTLTAHELFHQWFGNNVTCATWHDIWLNEGFASYGEYLALVQFGGPTAPRQWLDQTYFLAQNSYNFSTSSYVFAPGGSVRAPDTTNVGRIFSSRLSYRKGAAVVHMLRYLLNDDQKFFTALRTYQSTYSGRTARTRDLQRVFEQQAGRPLQYFFDQWYSGEGYPSFAVRWNQVGSTLGLRITETVSMPTVTPFFNTDVTYRVRYVSGQSALVRVPQTQAVTEFVMPVPAGQTVAGIDVDPDQWVLDYGSTATRDNALVLAARPARVAALPVYPNPCLDVLHLPALPARTTTAEVTDLTGRVVLRQALSGAAAPLRVQSLAPGLYQLRLRQPDGTPTGWARFVKQ